MWKPCSPAVSPLRFGGEAGTFGRVLDENGTEPHARVGRVDVHCQRGHLR